MKFKKYVPGLVAVLVAFSFFFTVIVLIDSNVLTHTARAQTTGNFYPDAVDQALNEPGYVSQPWSTYNRAVFARWTNLPSPGSITGDMTLHFYQDYTPASSPQWSLRVDNNPRTYWTNSTNMGTSSPNLGPPWGTEIDHNTCTYGSWGAHTATVATSYILSNNSLFVVFTPDRIGTDSSLSIYTTSGQMGGTGDPSYRMYLTITYTPPAYAPAFTSSPSASASTGTLYQYFPTLNQTSTVTMSTNASWLTYSGGWLRGTPTVHGSYYVHLNATGPNSPPNAYQNWTITVVHSDVLHPAGDVSTGAYTVIPSTPTSHYDKLQSNDGNTSCIANDGDTTHIVTDVFSTAPYENFYGVSHFSVLEWIVMESPTGRTMDWGIYHSGSYDQAELTYPIASSYTNYTHNWGTTCPWTSANWTLSNIQSLGFYALSYRNARITEMGFLITPISAAPLASVVGTSSHQYYAQNVTLVGWHSLGDITNYWWNWTDSTTRSIHGTGHPGNTTAHINTVGNHTVTLTVGDMFSEYSSASLNIYVYGPWAPHLTSVPSTPILNGTPVSFVAHWNESVSGVTFSGASWLTYSSGNRTVWGRAPNVTNIQTYSLNLSATSTNGSLVQSYHFSIKVYRAIHPIIDSSELMGGIGLMGVVGMILTIPVFLAYGDPDDKLKTFLWVVLCESLFFGLFYVAIVVLGGGA